MQIHATEPVSISKMFGKIAVRYDLANTVLSLGLHRGWRKTLIGMADFRGVQRILDCATGTGDLAFELERKVTELGSKAEIIASDFCEPMLAEAKKKAQTKGSAVQFRVSDLMGLGFGDASFDLATVAFGIRNVKDPVTALRELGRVVRPGGQVLVLEFGQPSGAFGKLYSWYSREILPRAGGVLTGSPEAYGYLEESSSRFASGPRFAELVQLTGKFSGLETRPMLRGLVYAYCLKVS